MSEYKNAKYLKNLANENYAVEVEINGVVSQVPITDNLNTDWLEVQKLVASGELTIAAGTDYD